MYSFKGGTPSNTSDCALLLTFLTYFKDSSFFTYRKDSSLMCLCVTGSKKVKRSFVLNSWVTHGLRLDFHEYLKLT